MLMDGREKEHRRGEKCARECVRQIDAEEECKDAKKAEHMRRSARKIPESIMEMDSQTPSSRMQRNKFFGIERKRTQG